MKKWEHEFDIDLFTCTVNEIIKFNYSSFVAIAALQETVDIWLELVVQNIVIILETLLVYLEWNTKRPLKLESQDGFLSEN